MLLPRRASPRWCRATAIVTTGLLLLAAALAAAIGGGGGALVVLLALAALSAIGIVLPVAATPQCRAVGWLVARVARVVRGATQLSCFAVVSVVGLTGTALAESGGSRTSAWTTKASVPADSYEHPYPAPGPRPPGWAAGYAGWAVRTEHAWTFGLIPFLALMRSTQEDDDDAAVRGEIYALY